MPKMSQDELFKLWKNRIDFARKKMENQKCEWEEYEQAYLGEPSGVNKDFDNIYYVNMPYVDMRSSLPKLYTNNPYAFIDPLTTASDKMAEVLENVVNDKKDDWKLKENVRAAIKETKITGRSYVKITYKFNKDKIGREYIGEEKNDEIVLNFIKRENLIIDPFAVSVASARWVAHEISAPISDIREKFNLKESDKPTTTEDKDISSNMPEGEKDDFKFGTYYEIENRVDHTLSIIVEGVNRFVVKPYECPYDFYSMYEELEWNDIPGVLDTKSDYFFWKDQLKELTEITTQKAQHRRKLNSKYVLKGAETTPEQDTDITTYKDATIVKLRADQSIEPFQHATLGAEVYSTEQMTRQDITIISGINEMKQGLPQSTKTAREAMAIVQESQDVVSDRVNIVDNFVGRILNKCIWFIQNRYDTTKVCSITGMDDAEFLGFKERMDKSIEGVSVEGTADKPFVNYVGTKLQAGKFKVRIKAGSSQPVDENQRRQDLLNLFEMMQKSQQVSQVIDQSELMKEVTKVLHLENKNIIINPKTPYQENAVLKRDIPVMPMLNENHDEHIAAHEIENNNTPAFIAHLMGHKMMKAFLQRSQIIGGAIAQGLPEQTGPGGLSQDQIGGVSGGGSMPSMIPQQSAPQTQPSTAGVSPSAQPLPN